MTIYRCTECGYTVDDAVLAFLEKPDRPPERFNTPPESQDTDTQHECPNEACRARESFVEVE